LTVARQQHRDGIGADALRILNGTLQWDPSATVPRIRKRDCDSDISRRPSESQLAATRSAGSRLLDPRGRY